MKITPELHAYPWTSHVRNNANSYLMAGRTNVLIDPGHLDAFPILEEKLEADSYPLSSIDLVIATHMHPDHMEAMAAFLDTSALMAMHTEAHKMLKEHGEYFFSLMGLGPPQWRSDFLLKEGGLTVGDEEFEVYHTPGHSPGSICLYWPRLKALFSGDLLFAGGIGRVDLPGGDAHALLASLDRIAHLDVELLLPGHGPVLEGAAEVRQNLLGIKSQISGFV